MSEPIESLDLREARAKEAEEILWAIDQLAGITPEQVKRFLTDWEPGCAMGSISQELNSAIVWFDCDEEILPLSEYSVFLTSAGGQHEFDREAVRNLERLRVRQIRISKEELARYREAIKEHNREAEK